ncbi:hypothetical protein GOEFS_096_00960 [Gordonia effusa NBRC 100432]|uniref:Uncharacterized protein n=1 Tax=Gordonia effusa NBRC 100432 TaxID=1077974 RepID=H0R4B8_9ACTN|nr:DUF2694 family protein [Gordonia effusa]GAB19919.1 hypothetical protein GOEFS_096_00960 [Gordonia effusa NBRC 100432]
MDSSSVLDAARMPSRARSRSGTIAVTTTPAGLPTSITIDDAELRRDPDRLAAQILALCRQAALAAGIRLREELSRNGFGADSLASTGLPTVDDLAAAERAADLAKL